MCPIDNNNIVHLRKCKQKHIVTLLDQHAPTSIAFLTCAAANANTPNSELYNIQRISPSNESINKYENNIIYLVAPPCMYRGCKNS